MLVIIILFYYFFLFSLKFLSLCDCSMLDLLYKILVTWKKSICIVYQY